MADDREVLREIWDGKIPVCFSLASEEIFGLEQPESLYLLVTRQSYFPLVTDRVQRHFARYVDQEKMSEMWLEFEGQPLKWHYPIGVLFDLSSAESKLPWNISVHFQSFPESEIMHCCSKEVVEAHFMSMVKEADSLKHRGHIVNGMQRKDHKQLWMGLNNDKFDQFWSVNRKLMEHSGDELFKHIPFRIYKGDAPFVQKLFPPMSDTGEVNTLNDLLRDIYPQEYQDESHNMKIMIQGIHPPHEVPIQWLSEHFSYPDNFLHICVLSS